MCPNCRVHPSVRDNCVWEEEQAALAEKRIAADAEEQLRLRRVMQNWEDGRAEREEADDMVLGVAEFMNAVESW